jgi:hypothetical protein
MALRKKAGVKLTTQLAMTFALIVVNEVMAKHGADCVITSGIEGEHSFGSLHYVGLALDFRGNHVPAATRTLIIKDLKKALGADYDVVSSVAGAIHVEYQPKTHIGG